MLCERCKKNPVDVHMKQIINGKAQELYLCHDCAQNMGYGSFSFDSMFKDMFDFTGDSDVIEKPKDVVKCSQCGMDYEEFKRKGKLGCSSCYKTFGTNLENALRSIHGSCEHKGKIPKKGGERVLRKREIENLRKKLSAYIDKEEFEEAAKVRDEIKRLSGGDNQ